MKIDAGAIEYLLAQEFGSIKEENIPRLARYDYPLLYDETPNMNGHVVVVPDHDRPIPFVGVHDVLYVCLGRESALSSINSGLPTLFVEGDASFRRLYNYMQDIFVRNERLDAKLRASVDTYMGFQPLLEACATEMGCSFVLIDRQYQPIAHANRPLTSADASATRNAGLASGTALEADVLETEAIDLFMASKGYRYMRASRNVFTMPGSSDLLMKNLFHKGHLVGTLIARHDGSTFGARYVRFLLNYLCSFAEDMYAQVGSFGLISKNANRIRRALENVVMGDEAARIPLEALLLQDKHVHGATYLVLHIERSFTHEGAEDRDYLARRFESAWPRTYCFTVEGNLYMLVDIDENGAGLDSRFLQELSLTARDNLCKIGVSRTFNSMTGLIGACAQASMALERGNQANPLSWTYRFDDYSLDWLLARLRADERSAFARHPAIEELAEYDAAHGSDLLETLRAFMDNRYNATDASRALFVARSTLLNRLERIQQITEIDLNDPRTRFHLALSFQLTSLP